MHPEIEPAIWSVIPFVLMLLAIAIVPLFAEHWWHSNKNKLIVSMVLGLPIAIYLISIGRFHDLEHQIILDYIPFVSLLAALFYISGGIVVRGDIKATPLNNSIFLFIGSVLASFIGTTGASMLLIRPLLKIQLRKKIRSPYSDLFYLFGF
jgi:Na+/H+ antiporter NhaD/arsenite permease-like protein